MLKRILLVTTLLTGSAMAAQWGGGSSSDTVTTTVPYPSTGAFGANASATWTYTKSGRRIFGNLKLSVPTLGSGSGNFLIPLPEASLNGTTLVGRDPAATGLPTLITINAGGTIGYGYSASNGFPVASGYAATFDFSYETAN